MDALRPDRVRFGGLAARAALVGVTAGITLFAAGSLILYEAGGALGAAGGLAATFAVALAAGLWAGAPGARGDAAPTGRWIFAGLSLALGGLFAIAWTVAGGERFGGPGRAAALLFMVGIPVYAAGFLLPALVAWEREGAADDEGEDADSVGLVGTAAVAVLVGLAVGAALAGLVLLPRVLPGPLLMVMGAILTSPLLFPSRPAPATTERVLHEVETPYNVLRVTETVFAEGRQPELKLYQDDEIESGELSRSGAPSFAYIAAAERWLGDTGRPGMSYLCLGGGAYTLPRRVAEKDPTARVTVVERDPEVTRVAYRYFGLRPEHAIATVHGDARAVAAGLPRASWDRVFLDVYDGTEMTPLHLVSEEAMRELGALLAPGGLLLMNAIGVAAGPGSVRLWSTVRTVAEVFPRVVVYTHLGPDFPDRQNFLLAAALEDGPAFPPRAGMFDVWPRAEWPRLPTVAVFRDREAQPAPAREATRA
ncbi:MAG TPA: fused MFS/spermidine synthase [Longimicrobium sp.]|nr:fused MFS/spermidine synthase [Longimicrobium sp.]